jgi:hypothetical protein
MRRIDPLTLEPSNVVVVVVVDVDVDVVVVVVVYVNVHVYVYVDVDVDVNVNVDVLARAMLPTWTPGVRPSLSSSTARTTRR